MLKKKLVSSLGAVTMLAGAFSANASEGLGAGIKLGGGYSFGNGSCKINSKDAKVESGIPTHYGAFVEYGFDEMLGIEFAPSFRMHAFGDPYFKVAQNEDEIHVERKGIDVDILFKVRVLEFEGGGLDIKVGPTVIINLAPTLKEKSKASSDLKETTDEKLKESFSPMFNVAGKLAVGARFLDDMVGAYGFFSAKFMNEYASNDDSKKKLGDDAKFGQFQMTGGLEIDFNFMPLI